MKLRLALTVAALCALALGLRLLGAGYGLPAIYNPDEIAIMHRALAFATGDLNPHNFLYPTWYFYVLFAWEGLYFVAGWAMGLFDSIAAFQREFFVDPSRLYLAGRVLTALCGTLTVWAVYRLAARLYGTAAGVVAALLLAAAPFAVRDAHYVKHDVPVTLLIVLTHVVLAGVVVDAGRRHRQRLWLLAGALAGLAMSTHYYAIFIVIPVAAAALIPQTGHETWSTRLTWLTLAGVGAVGAFFLASPFLLVEPATAWRDVVSNREIVMDRAVSGSGVFASLGSYLSMLATEAMGWPTAVAAVLAIPGLLMRSWRREWLLVAFTVPFLLFISNTVPAGRYLNPVLPFLAILAAVAVVRTGALFGRRATLGTGIVALAVALPGLMLSVATGRFFDRTDTRTLAQRYIEREIAPGASILVQPYSVQLRRTREAIVEGLNAHQIPAAHASPKFRSQLNLSPYPAPAYRTIYLGKSGRDVDLIYVEPAAFDGGAGLAPLRALAVDYVVLKRYDTADLSSLSAALRREGRLLATFSPYREGVLPDRLAAVVPFVHNIDARMDAALERPGPIIEIWRIN